jgi:hypothetical protein
MSTGPEGFTTAEKQLQDFDWPATSLGPLATWRPRILGQVEMVMRSRQPMYIALDTTCILFYNDA